jgi:thymidine kinase
LNLKYVSFLELDKNIFKKMSNLHIIFGPMFAGKSTYLINTIQSLLSTGIPIEEILIINHSSDTRYSDKSEICTHDNKKMSSVSLNMLEEIIMYNEHTIENSIENTLNNTYDITNKKYIFIDEGQFFTDLYRTVKTLLIKYKKTIYIGGLDGDYKQDPFYVSRLFDLIPYATTVTKLTSKCVECNEIAPFTKRIIQSNEQILVGGSDSYKPVCLNHL